MIDTVFQPFKLRTHVRMTETVSRQSTVATNHVVPSASGRSRHSTSSKSAPQEGAPSPPVLQEQNREVASYESTQDSQSRRPLSSPHSFRSLSGSPAKKIYQQRCVSTHKEDYNATPLDLSPKRKFPGIPVLKTFGGRLIREVFFHVVSGVICISILSVGLLIASRTSRGPVPLLKEISTAGRLNYLQDYLNSTAKGIHEKLEMVDNKAANQVRFYKKEMENRLEQQAASFGNELSSLRAHMAELEAALTRLEGMELLSVKDALHLVNSVVDKRGEEGNYGGPLSLDEVRAAARRIVEAELEKHAADGMGKVDYALGSGGGKVVGHSKGLDTGRRSIWRLASLRSLAGAGWRHPFANKILEPSWGEPGQCLPLAGSNVHVDIALRTAIYPEEVTLEHVSKNVAYDASSAPKDFRIYGWLSPGTDQQAKRTGWILLGEFTYSLNNKQTAQIFRLPGTATATGKLFSMIRLHVLSNYGSPSHTCIYRLRVHGSDPHTTPSFLHSEVKRIT